jgi:hypothetical protein
MSAEKIAFGALLAAGAVIFLVSEPDAASSSPTRAAGESQSRQPGSPVAAGEIRAVADIQRHSSASDCPNDPISSWTAEQVARLARCLSAVAPVQYEDGKLLTGARSEGLTLILDVEHPETLSGYVADHEAGAEALCQTPMVRDLVGRGVAVRLTVTGSDGSTISPVQVNSCA